jgi:hypothetical protein
MFGRFRLCCSSARAEFQVASQGSAAQLHLNGISGTVLRTRRSRCLYSAKMENCWRAAPRRAIRVRANSRTGWRTCHREAVRVDSTMLNLYTVPPYKGNAAEQSYRFWW